MYLKISEGYSLCHWKNGVYAIRGEKADGEFRKLNERQFGMLSRGEYSGGDALLDDLLRRGLVRECSERTAPEIREYDNYYFRDVIFSITGRCNYKCMHCSVKSGKDSFEVSSEQIRKTLREIKECGLNNITLIGGEPLIRRDFFDVMDAVLEEELSVASIYTNGSLINERVLDEIESRGIRPDFQISFDGCGFHDKMRGVKGAEKNFFKVLELLRKRNYRVLCYMSMTAESSASLRETISRLAQLGVSSLTAFPPLECGRWRSAQNGVKAGFDSLIEEYIAVSEEYILSDYKMDLELYRFIYIRGSDHKYMILPKAMVKNGNADVPVCRIYERELNISPEGYLSPCYALMESDFVTKNMPNIYSVPLKEALSDSEFTRCMSVKASDILNNDPECAECPYRLRCGGGCRSSALTTGDGFLSHDPMMCRFFKEGYYDRLNETARRSYLKLLQRRE